MHKKGRADKARSKLFSKLAREITVAAKLGMPDPAFNPRLRAAILAARAENMPKDNIERAVKKSQGADTENYDEIRYEGYGPGGVAVIVETVTDNKNRTLPEIRHILSKHGGNLAAANAVAWMFEKKGYIVVAASAMPEDQLLELVLEAGAEDLKQDGSSFEIYTAPESFDPVKEALKAKGVAITASELAMTPKNSVRAEGAVARKVLNLVEALEEHDDVQHVWANFDIDESEMEAS